MPKRRIQYTRFPCEMTCDWILAICDEFRVRHPPPLENSLKYITHIKNEIDNESFIS